MKAGTTIDRRSHRRERSLTTPEGLRLPIVVGSISARIAALILDFVILILGLVAIYTLLYAIGGGVFEQALQGDADGGSLAAIEFLQILAILVFFVARYGYFLFFELGPRGATPGKRLSGLRIAARDGGRLTAEAVVARNLIRDIELFLPFAFLMIAPSGDMGAAGVAGAVWFLVFMAFPFFNRDSLRAGDVIAGTWVVEAPQTMLADAMSATPSDEIGDRPIGTHYEFSNKELSIYGEHELQTLERVLRDDRQESLQSVHEAICRKIGWDPGSGDERAFLETFYAQLRTKLENDMRFGKRKRDKHS